MKKAFGKIGQALGEATGQLEATEIDTEYTQLESYTDSFKKGLEDVMDATEEYLIPDPNTRRLMKIQKSRKYKQPEGVLSEALEKTAKTFDQDVGTIGACFEYIGDIERQIADARAQMDLDVNEQFLEPVRQFIKGEVHEVLNHKKKFKGRRLDYDVKKRNLEKKRDERNEEAYRVAEGKFEESRELTMQGMVQLQNGEAEQISQLRAFMDAQRRFHETALSSLNDVIGYLDDQIGNVSNGPRREYAPMERASPSVSSVPEPEAPARAMAASNGGQQVRALFDFEAEQEGELTFLKDDIINLTAKIDENWYEGQLQGSNACGIFPSSYVSPM